MTERGPEVADPLGTAGTGGQAAPATARPRAGAGAEEWLGPPDDPWLDLRMAADLSRIGAAMASEVDLDRVVELVTDAATQLTGASFGLFLIAGDDGVPTSFQLSIPHGHHGSVSAAMAAPQLRPRPRNVALLEPTLRGERIVRIDDLSAEPGIGDDPPFDGISAEGLPVRSYLAVPIVSRSGPVLGGLFFGHTLPGVFTYQHERLVAGIAGPAAIAIDNARLHQAARSEREAARRERESVHRLAAWLSQMQAVSGRLAGARVVAEVAAVVVTGAAPALGCARASFFVLEEDSTLRLLHSFGYEGKLHDRWSLIDVATPLPSTDALRTRRLVLIADEDDWASKYPDVRPGTDRSVALAVIPFALGDQGFGVATFGWDNPRRFGEDEAHFLESFADQCSQALERARLYESERRTAVTLQRSLLPPRTPEVPGMEVAALYRAGDRSAAVGGDFYDVFRLAPNRWGIAMGDVCGRGASAASRTALVRYTLRALAGGTDLPGPIDVLERLNAAVLAEPEADDRFCATVYGHLELDRCGAWVTLACAGHPRPFVVRGAGWIDQRGQPGTLIGVVEKLDVTEDRVGLGPGDSLVFFTDGITEARNAEGEQFADESLPELLLTATESSAESVVEAVREAALRFSGGTLGDDLAVLVLRVPPEAADDADGRLRDAIGDDAEIDGDLPGYPVPNGGVTRRPHPPREARISLPPDTSSARAARRFLAAVLTSWRMPEMLEGDVALLLSELATNAVLHARSQFTVIVRFDGTHLRVEVGDGSGAEPRLRGRHLEDAPGGRGLLLIDTMASRWGILPTTRGKRVWFELPVPPAARA